jgi:hypothetical protein
VFVNKHKQEMGEQWFCEDCLDNKAQCFMCGLHDQQFRVKKCRMPYCSRFYCLLCVNKADPQCPIHKCFKFRRSSTDPHCLSDMVQCLRCPKAWHLECFEEESVSWERNQVFWQQSAHDQQRYLCYCADHEVVDHNHISWLKET